MASRYPMLPIFRGETEPRCKQELVSSSSSIHLSPCDSRHWIGKSPESSCNYRPISLLSSLFCQGLVGLATHKRRVPANIYHISVATCIQVVFLDGDQSARVWTMILFPTISVNELEYQASPRVTRTRDRFWSLIETR